MVRPPAFTDDTLLYIDWLAFCARILCRLGDNDVGRKIYVQRSYLFTKQYGMFQIFR
jgi:hypothetical protein